MHMHMHVHMHMHMHAHVDSPDGSTQGTSPCGGSCRRMEAVQPWTVGAAPEAASRGGSVRGRTCMYVCTRMHACMRTYVCEYVYVYVYVRGRTSIPHSSWAAMPKSCTSCARLVSTFGACHGTSAGWIVG